MKDGSLARGFTLILACLRAKALSTFFQYSSTSLTFSGTSPFSWHLQQTSSKSKSHQTFDILRQQALLLGQWRMVTLGKPQKDCYTDWLRQKRQQMAYTSGNCQKCSIKQHWKDWQKQRDQILNSRLCEVPMSHKRILISGWIHPYNTPIYNVWTEKPGFSL